MRLHTMEFELIDRIRARAATRGDVVLGIGDDAALLSMPPGMQLVVAMDTLNDGVHFPQGTAAADIGHKALAVNLSDLAAMGATPAWCTLSLSLPAADMDWVDAFLDGFLALADAHGIALVGGDTTRGPLSVCVAVHGFVEPGLALRRDGARVGDDVWGSGTLGDAAAGLVLALGDDRVAMSDIAERDELPTLESRRDGWVEPGRSTENAEATASEPTRHVPPHSGGQGTARPSPQPLSRGERGFDPSHVTWLRARLDRPTPRIALGRALGGVATACIDISDGLLADTAHIARASGVGLRIDVDALPASPALRGVARDANALRTWQSAGGDDYELCFTAPRDARKRVEASAQAAGVAVTRIGQAVAGAGVEAIDARGHAWRAMRAGYRHFD